MSGANRLGYGVPVTRSLPTTPTPLRSPHKISPLITKTPPHQSTLHMQALPDPLERAIHIGRSTSHPPPTLRALHRAYITSVLSVHNPPVSAHNIHTCTICQTV